METTKLYYHYDDNGFFTETSEFIEGEEQPENATLKVWEEPCFKPKFVDGEWIDSEPRDLGDDFYQMVEETNAFLKVFEDGGLNE